MILQTDINLQMENIIHILAKSYGDQVKEIKNLYDLKIMYNKVLSNKYEREINSEKSNIITNNEKSTILLNLFNGGVSTLDDKDQTNTIHIKNDQDIENKKNRLELAINELSLISNEFHILFNTVITDIFILPSNEARGGSSSTAVGIIWANPKLQHPINDIIEFLIHELTHNCMFIDELRFGHYNYNNMFDKQNWAKSAILNMPRPLDKVIHSLAVSLEIILFREHFLGHPKKPKIHPPTEIMLKQIDDSILSVENLILNNKNQLISDRVLDILENIKNLKKGIKC